MSYAEFPKTIIIYNKYLANKYEYDSVIEDRSHDMPD